MAEHGPRIGCPCRQCRPTDHRSHPYYPPQKLRWPTQPVTALQPTWTSAQWAKAAGCSTRNWNRWEAKGLPDDASDRVAVYIGMHPVQIWPDWLDRATDLIRLPRKRAA